MPGGTFPLWRRIIALRSRVILDRRTRRHWKYIQNDKKINEIVKKSVWGVSYSVFDGEELLESSLKSIRDSVDYINVVYQQHSWYGNPADPKLLPLLKRLQKLGLIDELIEYVPNYKMRAGKQEVQKRNIGLKYAKKHGIDYFMCMDTDEFYVAQELENAKRYIIKYGITHSFCPIVAYVSPTRRCLSPVSNSVQLFSRVGFLSKLKRNSHNVALVDPTRQLNHIPFAKYFVLPNIEMHHMTGFRKDMDKKLKNSSGGINTLKANDVLKRLAINSVTVPDIFNIKGNNNGKD